MRDGSCIATVPIISSADPFSVKSVFGSHRILPNKDRSVTGDDGGGNSDWEEASVPSRSDLTVLATLPTSTNWLFWETLSEISSPSSTRKPQTTAKKSSLSLCCNEFRTIPNSSRKNERHPRRRYRLERMEASWGARYCFHVAPSMDDFPTTMEGSGLISSVSQSGII